MTVLTIQPKNRAQMALFRNLAKQLNVNCYEKDMPSDELTPKDKRFLKKIHQAGQEARDIISGKMEGIPVEELFK